MTIHSSSAPNHMKKHIGLLLPHLFQKSYTRFFSILLCITISACANNGRNLSINGGSINITIPAELEVYEVDGKTLPLISFSHGFYTIQVTPGQHSMAIQYVVNWNSGSEDETSSGRIVKWQPVVFNHTFNSNSEYEIRFEKPTDYQAANARKSNPEIFLHQGNQLLAKGKVLDTPSMMDSLLSGRFRYGSPSTTSIEPDNSSDTVVKNHHDKHFSDKKSSS